MNLKAFKKLPKEKRKELVMVVLLTAMALGGLGFGLIKYQYGMLAGLEHKKAEVDKRLEQMHNMVRRAALTDAELAGGAERLASLEEDMAPRDIYSWFISTLRPFKDTHKIEFQQYRSSSFGEMNLLPKFPYKQATLTVEGNARFYDLGKFLADFENQFPHVRLLNLDVEPASGGTEKGMLVFKMDIVTLVKPNAL